MTNKNNKLTVACIQNNATPDVDENIAICREFAASAVADGAQFIALPEYFSGLYTEGSSVHPVAYAMEGHPVVEAFAEFARENNVEMLLGSVGVKAPDGRTFNRSVMLNTNGDITAQYDKIHMFDVDLGEGKKVQESATIAPGERAVTVAVGDAMLGLSICYDLRFAYLYRALAKHGADILAIPAAFTKTTGMAHWHTLNRARAIETGCFVVAPCQTGEVSGGGECYGHSLIINPWGEVLADGGEDTGYIVAELDLSEVEKARRKIPALEHDRAYNVVTT